jgi:ABC-type multidrug transport system ATPase subunit
MKQRLCLAKTLVHDPPVLILDEPASGLDPRARLEVKALLKELRTMGKTILISSHILTELAEICNGAVFIEKCLEHARHAFGARSKRHEPVELARATRQRTVGGDPRQDRLDEYRADHDPRLEQHGLPC